jgi:hypothetical protein
VPVSGEVGDDAARLAEKAGIFGSASRFFRRPARLVRQYMADDGAAGGRQLDRTMGNVRQAIDKYGIKMNPGARIRINRGLRGLRGVTQPSRLIELSPRAFENEEQLARTIYHENVHVGQINEFGRYARSAAEHDQWEQEAWEAERKWWKSHPLNAGGEGEK